MTVRILVGDVRQRLASVPDASVHTCVTSPPYFGLRDYGHAGQIGLEATPEAFVAELVAVFREVRRVLRDDGTLWLNLGDSYANNGVSRNGIGNSAIGSGPDGACKQRDISGIAYRVPDGLKPKDLIGIPWRVAFALQADGWYLRSDIIWHKPNPMPESVTDRPTKAHEYLFLLTKSPTYYYDAAAIAEPAIHAGKEVHTNGNDGMAHNADGNRTRDGFRRGVTVGETRNKRSVWTVPSAPFSGAHFATFPPALIEPCILAGCPPRGKRCDCDEIIETPTGDGPRSDDPSMETGRAGMNRPRRDNEGTRPVTRRQQRHNAAELRGSPHRDAMEQEAGASAFAHYIRTDRSGARPIPPHLMGEWMRRGWVTAASACDCPVEDAGIVLDPFGGAGTTGLVADRLGRNAILCELNPAYAAMARDRIAADNPMFSNVTTEAA